MKKNILTIIGVTVFIIGLGIVGRSQTTYKVDGTVTKIAEDKITFIDADGDKWSFYGDGYMEGDIVVATIFNNDTMTVKDDVVTDVKIKE